MARPRTISEEQRAYVLDLLSQGYGRNQAARETNLGLATITRIAQEHGVVQDRSAVKSALDAARDMTAARQLALLNLAAERAEELLTAEKLSAKDLQSAVTAVAIAIDKRRLITGEATERSESTSIHVYLPAKGSVPSIEAAFAQPLPRLTDGQREPDAVADETMPDAPTY